MTRLTVKRRPAPQEVRMFRNQMPRYEILSEEAMATARRRLASARHRDRRRVHERPRPRRCSGRPASGSRTTPSSSTPTSCSSRWPRRPREFDVQARNPERQHPHRRRLDGLRRRLRAAVRARGRRPPGRARWTTSATSPGWRSRSRCSTPPAGSSASRTTPRWTRRHLDMTLRAADADRQGLHGQRRLRGQRPRHHRDGRDPLRRRARRSRPPRSSISPDQLQLAAALGRPDARGAVRVRRGRPAGAC